MCIVDNSEITRTESLFPARPAANSEGRETARGEFALRWRSGQRRLFVLYQKLSSKLLLNDHHADSLAREEAKKRTPRGPIFCPPSGQNRDLDSKFADHQGTKHSRSEGYRRDLSAELRTRSCPERAQVGRDAYVGADDARLGI